MTKKTPNEIGTLTRITLNDWGSDRASKRANERVSECAHQGERANKDFVSYSFKKSESMFIYYHLINEIEKQSVIRDTLYRND